MKLNGRKPSGPKSEVVVLDRGGDGNDMVFICQAILDYKPLETILPRPEPKMMVRPGKESVPDDTDPKYIEALNRYGKQKMDWMILQSLAATPELEWERVRMNDPDTWHLWEEELKEAGTVERERVEILNTIFRVNSLTDSVFKEAKDRFLATQATRPS